MKYLSLFSGIGGFEKAINDIFPEAKCVGYSEIDKQAISIYKKHFPKHKNYGDITKIDIEKLPDFDLLVGGSPCQDLSIAKNKREGLSGSRSGLFWKYIEILKKKKPKYFILENVASMPKEAKEIISKATGVQPVMINASLVSAQNRKRLFWTNWNIEQPKDRKIYLKDIMINGSEKQDEKSRCIASSIGRTTPREYFRKQQGQLIQVGNVSNNNSQSGRIYSIEGKSVALQANGGGLGAKTGLYIVEHNENFIYYRKLFTIECERLQTFPDNWTEKGIDEKGNIIIIPKTHRYKAIGNAVNVGVVKHILNELKNPKEIQGQLNLL